MTEEINFNDVVARVKDALGGAGSSTGSTFFPTETSEEIIQIVYEQNFMRGLFPALPMTTRTINVPKLTGSVNFHAQTLSATESGTEAAESRQATSEITLTLKTMIANVPIGNYLIAYGVEGLLTVLRDDIASRLAFNEQNLFINADTETGSSYADNIMGAYNASTNTTGVNASNNDYLLELNGLRKSATATAVSVSGTFALSHLRTAIANLGVYADNRDELALIVPRNLEVQLLGLTELQTLDKYGPSATILSGEIGRIYGVRVFGTGVIPTNLNYAGVFDGSTTTQTQAILLHVRSPLIGNPTQAERRFNMGFEDEPQRDRFVLIPRQDVAFGVRYADAICLLNGIDTV
jgi:hypothetical protein